MLGKLKDLGTSKALSIWLESKLARYGVLRSVKIDSKTRSALLVLTPLGETEDVEFEVTRYEIVRDGEECRLVVRAVACSRSWLANLADDWLVGREFAIPALVALAL